MRDKDRQRERKCVREKDTESEGDMVIIKYEWGAPRCWVALPSQ